HVAGRGEPTHVAPRVALGDRPHLHLWRNDDADGRRAHHVRHGASDVGAVLCGDRHRRPPAAPPRGSAMKRTVGVITNPTSGSGRGARWGNEALAALSARGIKVRDLSRGSWGGAFEAAHKARRDLDALVVVGGDGMVHLGAQISAGRKKLPLGIMAAGSGNDAAVTYGLPIHDMNAAADRIVAGLEGDTTAVDLGKLSGPRIEEP